MRCPRARQRTMREDQAAGDVDEMTVPAGRADHAALMPGGANGPADPVHAGLTGCPDPSRRVASVDRATALELSYFGARRTTLVTMQPVPRRHGLGTCSIRQATCATSPEGCGVSAGSADVRVRMFHPTRRNRGGSSTHTRDSRGGPGIARRRVARPRHLIRRMERTPSRSHRDTTRRSSRPAS